MWVRRTDVTPPQVNRGKNGNVRLQVEREERERDRTSERNCWRQGFKNDSYDSFAHNLVRSRHPPLFLPPSHSPFPSRRQLQFLLRRCFRCWGHLLAGRSHQPEKKKMNQFCFQWLFAYRQHETEFKRSIFLTTSWINKDRIRWESSQNMGSTQ